MNRFCKFCIVVMVAVVVAIVPFLLIGELPGERWLSAVDDNALWFGLVSTALLAADVLLPVPSSVITAMLGARLDIVPAWGLAWIGMSLGNVIGYWVGRMWPQRLGRETPEQPTFLALVISRPVPILAEALTIAAGALRVDFRNMWLACAAGNALYALIAVAVGAALLPEGSMVTWLVLSAVLWVSVWAVWRFFGRMAYVRGG